jgi:hypothetical protein
MMAVSAMAYQYALLRLAFPKVVSTSVMTGNLTNAVLSLVEMLLARGSFEAADFGTEKLVAFIGRALWSVVWWLPPSSLCQTELGYCRSPWRRSRLRCDSGPFADVAGICHAQTAQSI